MDIEKTFPKTFKMFRFHRYVVIVISCALFIGASISAIHIGESPILGSLAALGVAILFAAFSLYSNKRIQKRFQQNPKANWLTVVLIAFKMSLLGIGIPAVKELLNKDNRALLKQTIKKNHSSF